MKSMSKYYFFIIALFLIGVPAVTITASNANLYSNKEGQNKIRVTGVVTDSITKEPLIGATVKIKGLSMATTTDINGKYSLVVPYGYVSLVISYIGYVPTEIPLKGKTHINVSLMEDSKALQEVVVVGYTKQRKETMVGSVATITTKDLEQSPTANLENALAGRLPGLIATQFGGGEPGEDKSSIYIRGKSTYGDQSPIVIIDGVERDMSYVSADEIESFTILKDASATAEYGIRGANGVIVITTKRGLAQDRATVNFKMESGITSPCSYPKYLGSADYATLYNEAKINDAERDGSSTSSLQLFSQDAIDKFQRAKGDNSDGLGYNIDYYKFLFKPGLQQNYSLSIRGGSDRAQYYVLAGYFTQGGNYNYVNRKNQDFTRYNFRSNVDIKMTKYLYTSVDLGAQITDRTSMGSSSGELMALASVRPPYLPIIVENNSYSGNTTYMNNHDGLLLYGDGTNRRNILGELIKSGKTNEDNTYFTGTFILGMNMDFITRGLKVEGMFSYDGSEGHWHQQTVSTYSDGYKIYPKYSTFYPSAGSSVYMAPGHYYGAYSLGNKYDIDQTAGDSFSYNSSVSRTYYQAKIDYARTFDKEHDVTAMLLANRSIKKVSSNIPYCSEGFTGHFSYYYNKTYLAEFNFGYNGSENFAKGHRFGFFPAVALGWVITNEPFMAKTNKWLDFLKLRTSYGLVGSDYTAGQRFLYESYYDSGNSYSFGSGLGTSESGLEEGTLANSDITWEKARKLNIGLDIQMFHNRLALTVDAFSEHRWNIVTELTGTHLGYPETSMGYQNGPYVNCGKVNNYGIDCELDWNGKIGRNFRYYIRPNFTFSRNKYIYDAQIPSYSYKNDAGKRLGEHIDYVFDHFVKNQTEADRLNKIGYQSWGTLIPGDAVYKDLNGDGVIDDNDETAVGNPQFPEIQFGIPIGIQYKNFDFSVLLQGSALCDMQLTASAIYAFPLYDNDQYGKVKKIHMKSWTAETAATAKLPALHFGKDDNNKRDDSSLFVYNSSYVRLKTIEVGYKLPHELIRKVNLEQVRFYAQGLNLLTFDKLKDVDIDPESGNGWGGSYPITKVVNFGVSITF
jgi:TonB-linked SusC/RagA family outer membrane protein